MPNYDLHKLHAEYNTKNMRVLLSRLLKKNPEFRDRTIVTYEVRDSGDMRLQVCVDRDEVRQVFLSPIVARRARSGPRRPTATASRTPPSDSRDQSVAGPSASTGRIGGLEQAPPERLERDLEDPDRRHALEAEAVDEEGRGPPTASDIPSSMSACIRAWWVPSASARSNAPASSPSASA